MCLAWGGDLATVTSEEDNTLVHSTAPAGTSCWIGLNDIVSENTWVWADGSTNTYTRWGIGEPNNAGGAEDCVHLHSDGYWNDLPCEVMLNCYYCSVG